MILLLDQNEEEITDILREYLKKRRFKGYNVKILETGIENQTLNLLTDIYLKPEFKNHKEKGNDENRRAPSNSSVLLYPK